MKKVTTIFNWNKVFVFHRWSNQPFSVFSSLRKVINIGVLTGVITLLNAPENANAQSDTTKINKHIELNEVLISGERSPVHFPKSSQSVTEAGRAKAAMAMLHG